MLVVVRSLNSKWMTGYFSHVQSVLPIASPSKSSRLPWNIALSADIVSDFPKRRGRETKNSFASAFVRRRWIYIVLSTYILPSLLNDGKSCVSVAIGRIVPRLSFF